MKGTKRLLIVLLSLMMVFTTMPASFGMAFAEDGTGEGLVDVQEDIQDNADLDQPTGDAAAEETAEPPTDTVKAENAEPAADAEAAEPAPEEAGEEEVLPESSVSYAVNGEAEAFIAHGKAAQSEEAAIDSMVENGIDKEEAGRLARKLFGDVKMPEDQTKDGEGDGKGDGEGGEGNTVSADGTTIGGIRVEWIVNDDEPYADSLLTVTPSNDADQMVKARVWFELSGENNYAPGTIRITIPAYIFEDRFEKDYGTIVIPFPEDPSKKDEFNWTKEKNEAGEWVYVLTNTRTFQSASQAFFEIIFAKLTPHNLIDMAESDPFNALIEVTTKNTTISLKSNDITARFDTSSRVEKVTKRAYGKPTVVSASAIPDDLRIPGEDKYVLIEWYVTVLNKANTWYYLDYKDWIPDEYRGFILSATPADPRTATVENVYHGYQTDKLLTFIVKTAYPFSEFEPDVDYTFHNNIEFTNRQEDPTTDQPTTAETKAETTWHYTDPVHLEPDGHYMIYKNGNDDTDEGNQTHKIMDRERVTNDLHMWDRGLEGWFGSYPSALNEMQKIYREQGANGQIRLSYTMDSVGYTMPWMFDDESVKGPDGNRAAWNIANYSRPVTMVTQDYGLRINRKGDAMAVHDEFEYLSVEFPGAPYVYRGKPNRINEDGTWYAQNYRDGTFLYTPDSDQANWPDIDLELLIDGTWQKYATASWKSGSFIATLADGTTQTNRVIDFSQLAGQVDSVRTVVTMQNTATEGTTTQAGISYDIRVVTGLKTTDKIMATIEREFEKSNAPQLYIWNRSNLTAFYPDGVREYDDDPIVSLGTEEYNYDDMIQNKDGYDTLSGYRTDLQVFPKKESSFDVTEIDYESGYMVVHYKASVEERSFIHSKKTYQEAIADGMIIEETSGVWRDLLPAGMIPILKDPETGESAIKVRKNDMITSVDVKDVPGTDRKLLEVAVDLKNTPTAIQVSGSNLPYYADVLTIEFDALLSIEEAEYHHYFDEGNAPHNVISFESSNDVIGTIDGYCGEPDKPVGNNVATKDAFKTQEEKDLMTNLDPDRDTPSFVYAGEETTLVKLAKGISGLHKDVEVNGNGEWSQGTYYGDPSNAVTALVGGAYRYRLKYTPEDKTSAEDIILYDSLENFYAVKGNDDIDINAPRWQGTFNGVNTEFLEMMGVSPVVYYSTVENLQLYKPHPDPSKPGTPMHRDFGELDEEGNPIWVEASQYTGDLSEVKAVAIDCTWKDPEHTQKFHLNDGETITVYINMIAPGLEEAQEYLKQIGVWGNSAQAYNNAYEMTTLIDDVSGSAQENFSVASDYTKVGLQPYNISVRKVWNDDNNRDGYRTDSVTITLIANGTATDKTLVLNEENKWQGTFEGLTYADPQGNKINYTIAETPVPDHYQAGIAITDVSKVNYVVTNKHIPETVNKYGMKTWKEDEESYRPEYITVTLYKSVYPYETETSYKVITVRPNGQGYWAYEFTDLPKNEDGKEIHYRIAEKREGKILSYAVGYDGDNIINTYHPYGDLTVEKELVNATAAASGKTFTFNFYFTNPDDDLPVMAKYNYDIIDLTTGDVTPSGTVEYGSKVTIRADQKIYVHDIDEYVDYEVTEDNTPGFTMTKATGNEGVIIPNEIAAAKFVNAYASNGEIYLKARKELKNRDLMKYQFHFEVYRLEEDGSRTLIRTASNLERDDIVNNPDESVNYSAADVAFGAIRFTDADDGKTFTYIIKERIPDDADENYKSKGYIYDPTEYTISVQMNDDGTGHMIPTYYDEEGNIIVVPDTAEFNKGLNFTNTYDAEGKLQLRVWKDLKGRKIKPGEFSFELLDEDGDPVGLNEKGKAVKAGEDYEPIIAANDENGQVTFPEFKYDQSDIGKEYCYAFREIKGTDETVIYDESVYGYKVTVTDNGDGTLSIGTDKATPAYTVNDDGTVTITEWTVDENSKLPVFVNPLKPGKLSVTKYISSDSVDHDPNQPFHFHVQLIGEDIPEGELEYTLTKAGQNEPDPDEPGTDEPGNGDNAAPDEEEEPAEEATEDESGEDADPIETERTTAPSEGNGVGASYHANNGGNIILRLIGKLFTAFADTAYAADDDIDSGTYEGIDWRITASGELILGNGGTQTLENTADRTAASWPWNSYRSGTNAIKSVSVDGTVIAQGSLREMFADCRSITSCNLSSLDVSNATNMYKLFCNCTKMTELDISGFNTGNVTNMTDMFFECRSLTELDVSSFNTGNVTSMARMFYRCGSIKTLDVSNWDTSKVTSMLSMFYECKGLTTLDVSNWNTGNVTDMREVFRSCESLPVLDVSKWNTSKATSTFNMFSFCRNLTELDVSKWNTSKITNFGSTFFGCSGLKTLDVSNWDTSKGRSFDSLFFGCSNLTEIDVSNWNTANVTNMYYVFTGCRSITSLDLSKWDTGKVGSNGKIQMFSNCISLSLIQLGEKFRFGNSILPTPPTGNGIPYTGKWIREDGSQGPFTPEELKSNFDSNAQLYAGTWIWEEGSTDYTIVFSAPDEATGSMAQVNTSTAEDYTLPANKFYWFKHEFDYWTDGRSRATYADQATIPAGTYAVGDKVTLTAHFKPINTTVNVVNGQFDFWLHDGETATFSDLPAGTSYQVWEDTPDGWVLIKTVDASGVIKPLETANAQFTNKYQPDVTTQQFFGTKMLDNTAAEKDAFQFVLTEEGNESGTITIINSEGTEEEATLPITVSTLDGGFVRFPVIEYTKDDVGEHTYKIAEVDPEDDTIDWDTHIETVTVEVSETTDGKLVSTKSTDNDGISFINKTRPGILKITKTGDILTDENRNAEFTFKVSLHNEKGQPFGEGDSIYWYKVDEKGNIINKNNAPDNGGRKASALDGLKTWAADTWEDIKAVFTEPLVDTAYGAEDDERSTEGAAYAVLTDAGELIFFRSNETYENEATGTFTDILGNTYSGKVYADLETTTIYTADDESTTVDERTLNCKWYADRAKISSIRVADGQKISPNTCIFWFSGMTKRYVTVDLNGLDTGNVKSMYRMFNASSGIQTLDVSMLDTSNVTNMTHVFSNCYSLNSINLDGWNTSKVTSMNYMFNSCSGLKELDLTSFNTSNVTDFRYMFTSCRSITMLDISSFDTSKCATFWEMFEFMSSLKDFRYGENFKVRGSINAMFQGCSSLTSLDLTCWGDGSGITGIHYLFSGCSNLKTLTFADDFNPKSVARVYGYLGMFSGCSSLEALDLTSWDTSNISTFGGMFSGCKSLKHLDLRNFDTRKVLNTYYNTGTSGNRFGSLANMFYGCTNLETLELGENFYFLADDSDRAKRISVANMFQGCSSLKELDLHNWDTHCLLSMDNVFKGTTSLQKIKLGDKFLFRGNSVLENAPTKVPYTGKWTKDDYSLAYMAADLKTNYNETPDAHAGTWIWEIDQTKGLVHFDAHGGYTSAEDVVVTSENDEITMPDKNNTQYLHFTLTGWNTDPEGNGDSYEPGQTYDNIGKLGAIVNLYAQWEASPERTYTIKVYKQNLDLATYSLAGTTTGTGEFGKEVTVDPPEEFAEYVTPASQTVTIAEDDSTVVEFYYDRKTFNISFDGNGATSGNMEPLKMIWGVSKNLPKNTYSKTGSLFTGWNTEKNGTGTSYADMQAVTFIRRGEGDATLYAQWMDNPNKPLTPVDGEIIVSCKVGETIVIPDLPAGTTYTIEELTGTYTDENGNVHNYMPSGWTQKGVIGEDGAIVANQTNEAFVDNVYHAEGQAKFEASKILEGGGLEEGQFEFRLYKEGKYPYKPQLIQTVYNSAPENGDNTRAKVEFDPIFYTEQDAGKTYTYHIYETMPDTPDGIMYDGHIEYVRVKITDNGDGTLKTEVFYDKDGAVFINTPERGALIIKKAVLPGSPEKAEFEFKVEFFNADGSEFDGKLILYRFEIGTEVDENSMPISDEPIHSGSVIKIQANESVGIASPEMAGGMTYKVTELDKAGWMLVKSEDAEGTIVASRLAKAIFTNEFNSETSIILEADKSLVGKDLKEGQFEFGVYDEDGVMVAGGKNDADGHITFSPIYYTTYDAGKTFFYTVSEIDSAERGYDYDATKYDVSVEVTQDKDGVLQTKITQPDKMTFVNTYSSKGKTTFEGTKTLEGRELKDGDVFTFEVKENGTNNVWTAVSDSTGKINYPVINYTYDPANKIDDTGTHEYTVRETSIDGNGITVDTNRYTVTVEVTEKGTGILDVKASDNSKALNFINTYEAEGDITFEGQKTITGREMTADDIFEFQMVDDKTGNIWNFKNDADGKINYPKLSYTLADLGEHSYTVKEISKADPDKGLGVDSTEYKVTVTVTDNGNGTLNVAGSDNAKALNFVNPYDANGEITFVGSKSVEGREMLDDDKFDFTLYGEDGKEIETVQNDGSVFKFSPIKYNLLDHGKEFKYTVKETSTAAKGVGVDAIVYHITVTVTDTGNGKLEVVSKTDEGPDTEHLVFVNPYDASGSITFEGTKTLKGRALTKKDVFSFSVSETGTDNVWTATNDETGKISYPEITYGLADVGTHTYTVRETSKTGNNITVDNKVYTVTVKVSDNKDGTLKVEADKECKALNFINTYEPPEEPKTGDTTNVMGYAFALTASLLALLILFRRRKTNE